MTNWSPSAEQDRKWKLFNGKQIDPTRHAKNLGSEAPYFKRGQDRVLMPDSFMPVGVHRGKHMRAVPHDYLLWVDAQPWVKRWAGWEAVHSYIERFIAADPETSPTHTLPDVHFWVSSHRLYTLPGHEDYLHAYVVAALNLKTKDYHHAALVPHYILTSRQLQISQTYHKIPNATSRDYQAHSNLWSSHEPRS